MNFKILFVRRMPTEDLSVSITTKIESFEKRMLLAGNATTVSEDDDYFAYYGAASVSDTEDAKVFIYTERDDVENVGNTWLSTAVDNLKLLCEMYEFPYVMYESPMENMEKVAAIKEMYRVLPNETRTIASAFGLSEAETDELLSQLSGSDSVSNNVADIPEDTEYVINNRVSFDGNAPDSYLDKPTIEAVEVENNASIKPLGSIDTDVLADKIVARMSNKLEASVKSAMPSERTTVNLGNILRGKTESIYEWAIRVFLSNPEVDTDAKELHTKIQGLIFKSLSYTYKAVESAVIKQDVATSTPVTEVEVKKEPEVEVEVETPEDTQKDEEVVETTKSIYTDMDDTTNDTETSEESIFTDEDADDRILLEAAEMSENDTEFFNYIKRFKDDLSTEALDSVAKYNMYYKITTGESVENSFVVYTKRKTALGL